MERLYNAEKRFMYRVATDESSTIYDEEKLVEMCEDDAFLEKIRIASKSLYDSILEFRTNPDMLNEKNKSELFVSIYKYYVRSKKRTTPFGLFAAVGTGEFSDQNNIVGATGDYMKKIMPDAGWLYGYIEKLEKEYYRKLKFKTNSIAVHDGNRITLLYTSDEENEEKSIRYTNVYKILENKCKNYVAFSDMILEIQREYPDVQSEVIEQYIVELIKNEILVSSLRPPMTNSTPMDYLMEECYKCGLSEYKIIKDIKEKMDKYIQTPIGKGIEIFNQLDAEMKAVYNAKETCQVDLMMHDQKIDLGYDIKASVEELANFLNLMSSAGSVEHRMLEEFRNRFLEKYGLNREVNVVEMMDPIIGIGTPFSYSQPEVSGSNGSSFDSTISEKLKDCLTTLYEEAVEGKKEIQLNDSRLLSIVGQLDPDKAWESFDMYFYLKENGDNIGLVLNENGGAPEAGKTFGRFSIHDKKISDILIDINQKSKYENVKTCEVNFLPSDKRNGNVVRCINARDYALGGWGEENKEEIRLENVLIGIHDDKFYARDKTTNQIIKFGSNNMYNKMLCPNVYRFLMEISNDGNYVWYDFPWKRVYDGMRHIPAIYYKDIQVSCEKWRLSYNEMGIDGKKVTYDDFKKSYLEYSEKRNIDRFINITEFDNKIQLDMASEVSMKVLYNALKKKKEGLLLEKAENLSVTCNEGCQHCMEIVVPVLKRNKFRKDRIIPDKMLIEREQYIKFPFEEWMYFKLYCKSSREEELISMELKEFGEKLQQEYNVYHFFMRYTDDRPHIRLRFGGASDDLYKAAPFIFIWLKDMMKRRIIGDYTLSLYEQETERYGGLQLVPFAEQLFINDSQIVEELIYKKRIGETDLSEMQMAVISVLKYVELFYDRYEDRLSFLNIFNISKFKNDFKKEKSIYVDLIDLENDWENFSSGKESWILDILSSRTAIIQQYKEKLDALSENEKADILYSVIHLHCNRMMGTDREIEQKIMYYAEAIMHCKKYLVCSKQRESA